MAQTIKVKYSFPGPQGAKGSDAAVTAQNVAAAGAFMKATDTLDSVAEGATKFTVSAAEKAKLADFTTLESIEIQVSPDDTTALTVGTLKKTIRVPYGFAVSYLRMGVAVAPTGADLIADVKYNGTSLFKVLPRIDAGKKTNVGSAVPYSLFNDALLDDFELTVDITQVGSTVAGAGLRIVLVGKQKYADMSIYTPSFTDKFSDVVAKLNKLYSFDFGSAKVSNGSNTPITNFTELATHFEAYSRNAGLIVINKENQRYVAMPSDPSTDQNFVMASDALELTATYNAPVGADKITFSPTANVVNSRTIPCADPSQIKIGQVVGYGVDGDANHARLRTHVIDGNLSIGDTTSLVFSRRDNTITPFTITATAVLGSTLTTMAQSMVDQINAHPTLIANNVQAYVMPEVAGGYVVSFPRRSPLDSSAPDFGSDGKGSLLYWNWGAATAVGAIQGLNTIGSITPGGSNVGAITWTKAVAYTGVDNRTVTITCTTGGGSGVAKVSIAATGTNTTFTTLTNQTLTNGSNITMPDGSRISPNIGTNLSVGDVWTVQLLAPLTHQARQEVFCSYVVEKGVNFIRVASPVNLTTSSIVTVSPTRKLHVVDNCYNKSAILIGAGIEAGIDAGNTATFSYQDNNLRIINSTGSGVVNIEANVYAYKGLIMSIMPICMALTNATATATDTLQFASVPANVKVGMFAAPYFGSPYSTGIVKVIAVTPTTVQLNTTVTAGSGTRFVFAPEILSAQIWSKFIVAPQMDNRQYLAFQFIVDHPKAVDIGAFGAAWAFTDTTDVLTPGQTAGTTEIDYSDNFCYDNNSSTNNYIGTNSVARTGTAQAGSSSSITLDAGANYSNTAYVGQNIRTTGGTGSGQTRSISAYDGTTKVATVSTPWTTPPASNTTFSIETVDLYTHPSWSGGSLAGNNLGQVSSRRIECIMTPNRAYYYLNDVLIRCTAFTWNTARRFQIAANLAVGTINNNFISNGFFPVDMSRFPMKYRIKQINVWASPNSIKPL